MELFYKKKFLLNIEEPDAAFLIRKVKKDGGRVEYDNSKVILKNMAALEVAKQQFFEL